MGLAATGPCLSTGRACLNGYLTLTMISIYARYVREYAAFLMRFLAYRFDAIRAAYGLGLSALDADARDIDGYRLSDTAVDGRILGLTHSILACSNDVGLELLGLRSISLGVFLMGLLRLFLRLVCVLAAFAGSGA